MDPCPNITLCLEFDFLRVLTYVCTVFSDDFMTPLIKSFSLYEKNNEKNYEETCLGCLKLSFSGELITGILERTSIELCYNS